MPILCCLPCMKNKEKKKKSNPKNYEKQEILTSENTVKEQHHKNPHLNTNRDSIENNDYAFIQDSNMTTTTTQRQDSNKATSSSNKPLGGGEYQLANDIFVKKSTITEKIEIDSNLYSLPKMSNNDKFSLIDDEEPPYIKIPAKNFDASIIYDINKSEYDKNNNNDMILNNNSNNNKDSDYYYTPADIDNNNHQSIYHPKSSHYEVLPDYEILTHMEHDNKNVSRLNVTHNPSNNIRHINVEENHYSNIDSNHLNNIQYMDINSSETVNNSQNQNRSILLINNNIDSVQF